MQAAVLNPRQASPAQLLEIQRLYGNRAIQRLLSSDRLAASQPVPDSPLQTVSRAGQSGSMQGGPLDAHAQSQIDSARGGGSPLDAGVGAQLGGALGADFSRVKVHTDPQADVLNRSLGARAFTTGSDIFFSAGAYQPGSSSGKQLLAHELVHVVQQGSAKPNRLQTKRALAVSDVTGRAVRSNRIQFKMSVGAANDRFEQEADRLAALAVRAPAPNVRRAGETDELQPMRQAQRTAVASGEGFESGRHSMTQLGSDSSRLTVRTSVRSDQLKQSAQATVFAMAPGLVVPPLTHGVQPRDGTIQRELNKAGQYVDKDLDEPGNYINPNFQQEVDADENRGDGKEEARKYSTVAGKGIGKFNKTTSNEELAMVEKKKAAEKDEGKKFVHQNSSDLGFLYAQAEMLKDTYDTRCHAFANATRGKLSKRPGDGLKGLDRSLEKINADYGGDASRMADLTGASIAFDNPDDLIECYKLIATDNVFKVTKVKNSLANAYSYGDVNMVVAIGEAKGVIPVQVHKEVNGHTVSQTVWEPYRGLQVELQLHLQPILTQKKAGHKQYEEQRGIEAKPIYAKTKKDKFLETPNLLPADRKRWEKLQAEMVAIYAVGWKKIMDQSEFSLDSLREEKFKKKMLEAIPPLG